MEWPSTSKKDDNPKLRRWLIMTAEHWEITGSLQGQHFELPPIKNKEVAKKLYAVLNSIGPMIIVKHVRYISDEWDDKEKDD